MFYYIILYYIILYYIILLCYIILYYIILYYIILYYRRTARGGPDHSSIFTGYCTPNPPANTTPTKIAWLKPPGKSPMDMREFHPLELRLCLSQPL